MATSEPLVPNDLPHGERQNVREGRRRAGLPNSPTGPADPAPAGPPNGARMLIEGTSPGARPVRPDFDPLLEASPDKFGFLGQQQQPQDGGQPRTEERTPQTVFAELASTANSGFARAVAARLAVRR